MSGVVPQFAYAPALAELVASLNASADEKVARFEPWIAPSSTRWIVDMGAGPGGVAAGIAQRCSGRRVLAIDSDPAMNDLASRRHCRVRNLEFLVGDAREYDGIEAAEWLLSSVLHEVTAQGGLEAVGKALKRAASCLTFGGRLILRDFVRPWDASRQVALEHDLTDIKEGRSFPEFVVGARYPIRYEGCRLCTNHLTYKTDMGGAYEFVFRKDWGAAWSAELSHRYGFWTQEECRDLVCDAGLRLLQFAVERNNWVIRHRIRNRIRIRDPQTGALLATPAYQVFLVAEKPQAYAAG